MIRIRFDGRSAVRFLSARLAGLPWVVLTIILRTRCRDVITGFGSVSRVTPDDQADETGTLTRRELRRRKKGAPIVGAADVVTRDSTAAGAEAGDAADAERETVGTAGGDADGFAATQTAREAVTDAAIGEATATAVTAPPAAAGTDAAIRPAADAPDGIPAEAQPTAGARPAPEPEPPDDATALLTPVDDDPAPVAAWADEDSPPTALLWVDPIAVEAATLSGSETGAGGPEADVLADAPRRGILRSGVLFPLGTLVVLVVAYSATTLLWPLHEVAPTIEAVEFDVAGADAAALTWPAEGSAAISVEGVGVAASSGEAVPIASITKVVSAMLVLEELPLQLGEQGPEFSFTYGHSREYWSYLSDNQSALGVPAGGTLTEYQMLQGILLGSANNYIDRLAEEIWGSESAFAEAAEQWLSARGLDDITIVTPSGRNSANVASPESLTELAEIAMANPVFAEIVGTASVELPGAGTVTNTNGLLGEPGITGVKTGSLAREYHLLSAKEVTIGDTTVTLYAAVLGQDDDEARLEASRTLYTEVEAALQAQGPAVASGTVVGEVSTVWGTTVDVVTDADASVLLWNSATPTAEVSFDLGETTEAGADVGTLTVNGPVDSTEVAVALADEIEGPSAWWRLTHPLELLGIVG